MKHLCLKPSQSWFLCAAESDSWASSQRISDPMHLLFTVYTTDLKISRKVCFQRWVWLQQQIAVVFIRSMELKYTGIKKYINYMWHRWKSVSTDQVLGKKNIISNYDPVLTLFPQHQLLATVKERIPGQRDCWSDAAHLHSLVLGRSMAWGSLLKDLHCRLFYGVPPHIMILSTDSCVRNFSSRIKA